MAGLILGYIVVAMVPFILIIAAIAIPNLLRAKMAANEASAVGTLRAYNATLSSYAEQCPDLGYPSNLAKLGPVEGAKDKCARTFLLDQTLTAQLPVKAGYHFFYMPQAGSSGSIMKYVLAADPVAPGASGVRHFFTDESGVIRYSTRGGADVNSEPLM